MQEGLEQRLGQGSGQEAAPEILDHGWTGHKAELEIFQRILEFWAQLVLLPAMALVELLD